MSARVWQVGDIVRGASHFGHHRDAHRYRGAIREVAPARVIPGGTRITARAFVFDGDECVGFFVLKDDLATLDDPMRQSLGGTVGDEVELLEAAPAPAPAPAPEPEPLPALVQLDQAHAEARLIQAALAWEASEHDVPWVHTDAQDELRAAAHDYRKVMNR